MLAINQILCNGLHQKPHFHLQFIQKKGVSFVKLPVNHGIIILIMQTNDDENNYVFVFNSLQLYPPKIRIQKQLFLLLLSLFASMLGFLQLKP